MCITTYQGLLRYSVDRSRNTGYNVRNDIQLRGVAQPGSAPEWGSGGRWFKSSRPDHVLARAIWPVSFLGTIRYSPVLMIATTHSDPVTPPIVLPHPPPQVALSVDPVTVE
ncbi:MAG: hypothetical protein GFH27_549281n343 [Chloroflexi bacterium AL-W]|nr:hypothetical protein [Chloroflexi bacterium AL-N1]NOK66228.1 hypothetical protein [Chloroflexi bacterium AL-N10]NOK73109.1 hypothetical protein [Chloroflexi bacterium AL-N5]NOK80006.1 hypothetical protein [Chloroflexi bacterium AL-W]NOK88138.1 hypothetical protein [Chloroflexi bacterium AL-N15]